MKNRELIENLVAKAPGVKKNQDLLNEMVEESLKRAGSFLENSSQGDSEVYIKKIVNSAVIDIIKNADKIRTEKDKKSQETNEFQEVELKYETDVQGKIVYSAEVPEEECGIEFSDEQINLFKDRIKELDSKFPAKEYKRIFELRYLRGMDYQKTAKKLKISEEEVLKVLQDLFKEINLSIAG